MPDPELTHPENERYTQRERRLGKLPARSDPRTLPFARFAQPPKALPPASNFWPGRAPFPERSFGNTALGDCTFASQALAAYRFERLETRHTIDIADDAVVNAYLALTARLYGGGDTGAFEEDALNNWRHPETTFRDTRGRALVIDAYTRVDPKDQEQVKSALLLAGTHGIKVCFNLPLAWQRVGPGEPWTCPDTRNLTGLWLPGSWGGHSMFAEDYDSEQGIYCPMTWDEPGRWISWDAVAAYMDEAHLIIDSWDYWRLHKTGALDLAGIRQAVNRVSSRKIG